MTSTLFKLPANLVATAAKQNVIITVLHAGNVEAWLNDADAATRHRAAQADFTGRPGQVLALYDDKGVMTRVLAGANAPVQTYDMAPVADYLARALNEKTLKAVTFKLEGVKGDDATNACIGWGISGYRFEDYKARKTSALPRLVWPKDADKKSALAHIEAMVLVRTLINIPANDMGPDELEKAARAFSRNEELTIKIIKDKELVTQNFPMIWNVGKGSSRRPRLIDMKWGDPKHPKVTLVGKGVCFDTGGLDLKPGTAMHTMKKDLGGGAHVMALALLIIRHQLPVRLRVLIPAVENSVSGDSYRPSDIITSRKGITVEVGDTDAEGRLILSDALALASEEKPEFMVNFATLTGGVAIGPEVPAMFSNNEKMAFAIKDISEGVNDALWPLPLIQSYRKHMASDVADINSVGNARGGTVHAALFLETFVDPKIDWVHIDLFAWETGGRPGRTRGGTEMGLRAMYAYIAQRFGKKKTRK